MARKKLDSNKLKVKQINFSVTSQQFELLTEQAEACGLSINSWIRKYVFGKRFPTVKMSALETNTYLELNKIGINLNQVTRSVNRMEGVENLTNVISELQAEILEIKKKLINDC